MNPHTLPDEPSDVDPEPAELTEPSDLEPEPADPADDSDLEFTDMPCTDAGADVDESQWEAFLPDDDGWDPEPEPGDFWIENRLHTSASACLLV